MAPQKHIYLPTAGGLKIDVPRNPRLAVIPGRMRSVAIEMLAPGGGGGGGAHGGGGGGGSYVCVVVTFQAAAPASFTFTGGQWGDGGESADNVSSGYAGYDGIDIDVDFGGWGVAAYAGSPGTGTTGGDGGAGGVVPGSGWITQSAIGLGGKGGTPPGTPYIHDMMSYYVGGGGGQVAQGFGGVLARPDGTIELRGLVANGIDADSSGNGAGGRLIGTQAPGRGGNGGGLYVNRDIAGPSGLCDAFNGFHYGGGGGGGGCANGVVGNSSRSGGGCIIVTYDYGTEPSEDEAKAMRQRYVDAYINSRAMVSRQNLTDGSSTEDFMAHGMIVTPPLMIMLPIFSSPFAPVTTRVVDQVVVGGARTVPTFTFRFSGTLTPR